MDLERIVLELWQQAGPWLDEVVDAIRGWGDIASLAAFLIGAAAVVTRARILVFGVLLLFGAQLAIATGHLPVEPAWLLPIAACLLFVGVFQGIVVTLLGEDGGSQFLSFVLLGLLAAVAFLLWSGPKRAVLRFVRRGA